MDRQKKKHTSPDNRNRGIISGKPGEFGISLDGNMVDPQMVFYADHIIVKELPEGYRLIAIQEDPFSGDVKEAFQLILCKGGFNLFRSSVGAISDSLRSACARVIPPPEVNALPASTRTCAATVAMVSTHGTGITMDFYYLEPITAYRISTGSTDRARLRPVVRIDTLPGRLNHLLEQVE